MDSDFINVFELMQRKESDLPTRLASQEEALGELTCTERRLGKWFEENTVSYVLAAFNLNDKDFAEVFPPLKHISAAQRQNIIQAFEEHLDRCPRCFRKRSFDLEFEGRLESALHENREVLLAKLDQPGAGVPPEQEHLIDGKARFAHHS
jgi:hypothetical protein